MQDNNDDEEQGWRYALDITKRIRFVVLHNYSIPWELIKHGQYTPLVSFGYVHVGKLSLIICRLERKKG
jgi:hypothetical protein